MEPDYLTLLRANVIERADALEMRDRLVIAANKQGKVPVTTIAETIGLTRQQIHRILNGHYALAHLHWPDQPRIGTGPVVSVVSTDDGYPNVIDDMRDVQGMPVHGRWLFDGESDDGRYVHYRLDA